MRKISDKKTTIKPAKTREKKKENEIKKNAIYDKIRQARHLKVNVQPQKSKSHSTDMNKLN